MWGSSISLADPWSGAQDKFLYGPSQIPTPGMLFRELELSHTPECEECGLKKTINIGDFYHTYEKYVTGSIFHYFAIEELPSEFITVETCLLSIYGDNEQINYVPKNIKKIIFNSEKIKLDIVRENGFNLRIIPIDMRTSIICHIAVSDDPYAIKYVPDHLITDEICILATKSNTLNFIPMRFRNEYVCSNAIKYNVDALKDIPKKLLFRYSLIVNCKKISGKSIPFKIQAYKRKYVNIVMFIKN